MSKPLTIRQQRNRSIKIIKDTLDLVMWESGYRTGGMIGSPDRRALRLWVPLDPKTGKPSNQFIKIGGYVAHDIEGFCEHGVITDSHGGGMVWQAWSEYPLEDLLKIENYVCKIDIIMAVTK